MRRALLWLTSALRRLLQPILRRRQATSAAPQSMLESTQDVFKQAEVRLIERGLDTERDGTSDAVLSGPTDAGQTTNASGTPHGDQLSPDAEASSDEVGKEAAGHFPDGESISEFSGPSVADQGQINQATTSIESCCRSNIPSDCGSLVPSDQRESTAQSDEVPPTETRGDFNAAKGHSPEQELTSDATLHDALATGELIPSRLPDSSPSEMKTSYASAATDATYPPGPDAILSEAVVDASEPAVDAVVAQIITAPHKRVKRRHSKPSQPRPTEEPAQFEAGRLAIDGLPDEYAVWNRAIVKHALLQRSSPERLYLTITPRILARIATDMRNVDCSPEEAESEFVRVISKTYHERVLPNPAKLRILRRLGEDELPECVGFLALSVLAAYRMQADDEAAGHAYYARLANLLRCDVSGGYPVGFDPAVFESLWNFYSRWLTGITKGILAMPGSEVGFRRFVAIPLSHVPLRCLDIEKLPNFFAWAHFAPGIQIPFDRLCSELMRWQLARCALTPVGVAALTDDRRPAVLAQVSSELEAWDGSVNETARSRSAAVEILLDVVRGHPSSAFFRVAPPAFRRNSTTEYACWRRQVMAGMNQFRSPALPTPVSTAASNGECMSRARKSCCGAPERR